MFLVPSEENGTAVIYLILYEKGLNLINRSQMLGLSENWHIPLGVFDHMNESGWCIRQFLFREFPCLFIPVKAAANITANFLGLDMDELDGNQQKDTVKEALNMIGGSILSTIDKQGDFKLGIPKTIDTNDLSFDRIEGLQGDFVLFETEDNRLAAGIVADGSLSKRAQT